MEQFNRSVLTRQSFANLPESFFVLFISKFTFQLFAVFEKFPTYAFQFWVASQPDGCLCALRAGPPAGVLGKPLDQFWRRIAVELGLGNQARRHRIGNHAAA